MKKLLMLFMGIALVAVFTACSSDGGEEGTQENASNDDGEKSISILTPYLSSVTTKQMVDEIEVKAKDNGWKVNVIDTKGDAGGLASRMEDVILAKTDAIVIVSTDPNQVAAQIKQADDAGIPVFGSDSGYIEGMTMNATSDNEEMSKMMTEYLFEQLDGKGKLIVLTHRPHPGVLKRTETLDALLEEYPDIEVLTEQEVEVPGPIESARQQMENLLLANKDDDAITAVWAGWDEPAIGAAQAIEADGRDGIIVTGIDGNSQAVEMIKDGSPIKATVEQNFIGMSEIVIEQMEKVFNGEEVDGTELYAPATLITAE
ncbi:sugar ABC transporter substrate-binding protein [Pseudogracilibacillus auburnensis]|uniref:Monosaccharide ABC transporter substrate-binding protein (CUT2 family) n=1 Tax=Pseudogracilibacillus auburnensis TaxID=1494959 RepID=A0A2V3W820_9BACI|nr:sugar ABC transporter substrate-binding protein [Pseudogracilibacillus auburnensis]MBO1001956.1 sugar ABC transporter substrate-binding protein [Pseudogracilibacillus auburnensis]PXW90180.1 monosaccharide ABC transporter substrate-binding protein (CUT2 family) [Pseudogracilibacillus auburnensis]